MRYCTASRMGFTPSSMSRSNSDWLRPARAADLESTTGPSWQWSPTSTSCREVGGGADGQAGGSEPSANPAGSSAGSGTYNDVVLPRNASAWTL
jgi:hypothetical protein